MFSGSPFAGSSRSGMSHRMASSSDIGSSHTSPFKSPCQRDRFVSPCYKTPTRSPSSENYPSGNIDFSATKNQSTPTTPRYRKIPSVSERILDAPNVVDECPTKLIDFSEQGDLAVALGSSVYIWHQGGVSELFKGSTVINAVCWVENCLAISGAGHIELFDVQAKEPVRFFEDHQDRAAAMSARGHRLATGGADGLVKIQDIRVEKSNDYRGHSSEVCSVEWSLDGTCLASGGADNKVIIWGNRHERTIPHDAPVQALAWMHSGVLLTGDMGQDGTIRLIHTRSDDEGRTVVTGSPVSGLCWTDQWGVITAHTQKETEWEIWTTDMRKIANFGGHASGIINIAASIDGKMVATIGGDETLRLWDLKEPAANQSPKRRSSPFTNSIR